jgi:hypothetical protein
MSGHDLPKQPVTVGRNTQKSEVEGCSDSNLNADQAECLEAKLERELANFMRTRQRK